MCDYQLYATRYRTSTRAVSGRPIYYYVRHNDVGEPRYTMYKQIKCDCMQYKIIQLLFTVIVAIYELLHAAGLLHEQSRTERDYYIKIFLNYIWCML